MAGQDPKFQKEAADQNFDYMFKLLIIGNSSVGKTSFLFRYADDSFTSAFVSTVGIDFKVKTVFRHDKRVKLQIWVSITPYVFPLAFPLSYVTLFLSSYNLWREYFKNWKMCKENKWVLSRTVYLLGDRVGSIPFEEKKPYQRNWIIF